jgi:hypothetical protein
MRELIQYFQGSQQCHRKLRARKVLSHCRYVRSPSARPFALFFGVTAASPSNTNGNSSLSSAPSSNPGASDLVGFKPSCLNF